VSRPRDALVVETHADLRVLICEYLQEMGFHTTEVADAPAMRAALHDAAFDLIVLDATTSEDEEVTLAMEARNHGIRLVMISGGPELMELFRDRADQLLWKPFRFGAFERAVRHAFASDVRGQRKEDPD
jgi:DNA-binding response OmpR family regulator